MVATGPCPMGPPFYARQHNVTHNVTQLDGINGLRYHPSVIQTFATKETAALFAGLSVRRFGADWAAAARRKLDQIHAATTLDYLRTPPGNRLERLSGDRDGQWSIRINGQWRVCFVWRDGHAWEVEIIDYH